MKTKTQLSNFNFQFSGYGHYRVTYTSPAVSFLITQHITLLRLTEGRQRNITTALSLIKLHPTYLTGWQYFN